MAHVTEIAIGLNRLERIGSGRRVMATIARPRPHRVVKTCLQEIGLGGRMRVVTDHAGLFLYRIILMRLLKCRLVRRMTALTECLWILQEKILVVGAVGRVTGSTPLLPHDLMNDGLLIVLSVMALITKLTFLCIQEFFAFRGVGIMAGNALSGFHGGMHLGLVHPDAFRLMAFITHLVAFLLEGEFRYESMPQMAAFAIPGLDGGVYILHPQILLAKILVTVQTILPCHRPPPHGWLTGGEEQTAQNHEKHQGNNLSSRIKHCHDDSRISSLICLFLQPFFINLDRIILLQFPALRFQLLADLLLDNL
jgi:hypothetical protein